MLVALSALVGACMETRRSLGEDCLKNDDCLSGVCSQLRCASVPTTTDTRAENDASTGSPAEGGAEREASAEGDEEADSPWDDGDRGD